MATFTANTAVNFQTLDVTNIEEANTLGTPTATSVTYQSSVTDTIGGTGFVFDDGNVPTDGQVTSWSRAGVFTITDIPNVSLVSLFTEASAGNTQTVLGLVLAGNDDISGSTAADYLIGYAGADAIDGGKGDDTLEGGIDNDTLTGNAGNDSLIGGKGDDLYIVDSGDQISEAGGDGTDEVQSTVTFSIAGFAGVENLTLTGASAIDGTGNDEENIITGNSAANELAGGDADDTLIGGGGPDTLLGEGGNDSLLGEAGLDSLSGGIGDDTIDGGADADSLDGGDDNDSLIGGLANDTLLGQAGTDQLEGGAGIDSLSGGTENDTLDGGTENDTLDGGTGLDSMVGGDGNDTYIVDQTTDIADETSSAGVDLVKSSANFTLGTNVENLTLTGSADITGTGNGLANIITGNDGANTLSGDVGADSLDGGKGNDKLLGGTENDSLTGGADDDSLDGGGGADTLSGGDGNDTLLGGTEDDSLLGGIGNDSLDGGAGADTMSGAEGDDTYTVDDANDEVSDTGAGTDLVKSSVDYSLATAGSTTIENLTLTGSGNISGTGNTLANVINGNTGNNSLFGGDNNDSLSGGDGLDTLQGDAGTDTLAGGAGNDVYVVDSADKIQENAASGIDEVQSAGTFSLASFANVENLTLTGAGAIDGSGNAEKNTITGGAGDNSLFGDANDDHLVGSGGDDTLDGGLGNDTLEGGEGSDVYVVDSTADVVNETGVGVGDIDEVQTSVDLPALAANLENLTLLDGATNGIGNGLANTITGNNAANSLDGGGANDSLVGGLGNDTLEGNTGNDTMVGGDGGDVYFVDSALDVVTEAGASGTDEVRAIVSNTLAGGVENLTLLGTDSISGTGNTLANLITGNSGKNTLDGGDGNDHLVGLGGNDSLLGGKGDDSLEGGDGNDTLQGGAATTSDTLSGGNNDDLYIVTANETIQESPGGGIDTVQSSGTFSLASFADVENLTLTGTGAINGTGNGGKNVITGGTGANSLSGAGGDDTLIGDAGNDTLDGGLGNDSLTGGEGSDVYIVDSTADIVNETGVGATDVDEVRTTVDLPALAANVENLTLLGAATKGIGNTLDNVITGNSNDNSLDGGVGADTMAGGDGNDIYVVDTLADDVNEVGTGTDEVQASITYSIAAAGTVENLTLTGSADIDGTGNTLGNVITGNGGKNSLSGGDGNDLLVGNAGLDTLLGGNDNDTLQGGADADSLSGDAGDDSVDGGAGADTLVGGAGTLDTLAGGADDDLYIVDSTTDTIVEGSSAGSDTVQSSVTFSLAAIANVEHLTLTGAANINGTGNDLANKITGNSGNNVLDGGKGVDTLTGGEGNDTYIVDSASDVVTENGVDDIDEIQTTVNLPTLAANVENLTLLTGATTGIGNTLDNKITGNNVANTLDGGAGADTLIGGDGNDVYVVDATTDVVAEAATAGSGIDEIKTSINLPGLAANVENLTLLAGATIGIGNGLANTINGNAVANTLDGGIGADSLLGGDGDDIYIVDDLGDKVTELANQGIDTVKSSVNFALGADVENLTLLAGATTGTGNGLANIITGNTSANTLDGGIGADSLIGDEGNDTYIVDNTGDVVTEAGVGDIDEIQTTVNLAGLAANVENLTLLTGATIGIGNELANKITGNAAANTLDGGTGADNLIGGDGSDTYVVDNASDVVTEAPGEGTADLVQSSVNFILGANVENLTLLAGAATGKGNGDANIIIGNASDNTLDGAAGADNLSGGDGNDTYIVDDLGDVVTEAAGKGVADLVQSSVSFILGANVDNLTLTGTAATGKGNADANIITGNASDNTLDGAAGADNLIGGEGNDTYIVDSTSDVVNEAGVGDTDEIQTTINLPSLAAGVENLTLLSGATIGVGNSLANTINGNAVANTLDGGAGADNLIGGDGNDTYIVDNAGDVVTEDAGKGTADLVQSGVNFILGANVENLTLLTGAATGKGNADANIIIGNASDNTLDGAAGADNLSGGDGNDTYIADDLGDVVSEAAGKGTADLVQSSVSFILGANVDNLTLTGTAATGKGNGDANIIIGNASDNTLDGAAGADNLSGGDGNDTYVVDDLGDVVAEVAGKGTADLVQSSVSFILGANVENLTLLAGAATGKGNADANIITGNASDNTLDGAAGADNLAGGDGSDTYVVDNAGDVVTEDAGKGAADLVQSSVNFILGANVENLTLLTGAATGKGNGDANIITGNASANTLDGAAGADNLIGGDGNDTYLVDNVGDVVTEASGEGTADLVQSSVNFILGANVDNLTLLAGAATGKGNGDANIIIGNASDNTLDGAAGADNLSGGDGNDTYVVDDLGDVVSEAAGKGTADLVQSSVSFILGANVDNLTLLTGAATGKGNGDANIITGNASDNTLDGAAGADNLSGGDGNDTYIVDDLGDVVTEAAGKGAADLVQSSVSFTLGANVDNLTLLTGAVTGKGNADANIITGNASDNTLDGAAGADNLIGGEGNDTYIVDSISDVINEAGVGDTDEIQTTVNLAGLVANVENLTLLTGATVGIGNELANKITGNAAANTLDGGTGADSLVGGDGSDTYTVDNAGDVVTEDVGKGAADLVQSSVNFILGANVENLNLTGTAATGKGNADANIINGNGSDNTLDGAAGADNLAGGDGNDTYIVDDLGDVVTEAAGKGTADLVQSSVSFILGANVDNLTLTGTAATGTGNADANTITGNASANTLDGAAGADNLIGGEGDDVYLVDSVSDVVTEAGAGDTDEIRTSVNLAALAASVENLTLLTGATIGIGNGLANTITGNAVANTLDGGAGADNLLGGDGNDTYIVDNVGDVVTEAAGKGTDLIQSSVNFVLGANVDNLTLTGTAATAKGNDDANIITGNDSDNTLDGAGGVDNLIGGAGDDLYVVDSASDVTTEDAGKGTDAVQTTVSLTLAANIENLTLLAGAVTGTGNALNNIITGNASANTLDGAAGADNLAGGDGNDTYIVDDLGDAVTEAAGKGTDLVQSAVSFTLGSDIENLTLTGTAATGSGNVLANIINGNASANTLDGAAGADNLAGGDGNDTYIVDDLGDAVTEAAGKGTLDIVLSSVSFTLGANVENLTLTGTAATGKGNADANTITGNASNNTLDGAGGVDNLIGGDGNDTYLVDSASDVTTEDFDKGTDLVQTIVSLTLAANIENLTLLTGAASGTGNVLANTITGNASANTLDGAAGADNLLGGDGNDTYIVDDAGDVITELANKGTDLVQSGISFTLGADIENLTLTGGGNINGTGNALANIIAGNTGNNSLFGGADNDKLSGNDGSDTLDGGLGIDSMIGGLGDDRYIVDAMGDVITELSGAGSGTDTVETIVDYTLNGNIENLILNGTAGLTGKGDDGANAITGNSGANSLFGAGGDDTLTGGGGNDTLSGDAGSNKLVGGLGDDLYIINAATDKIFENKGEGTDTVQLNVTFSLGGNTDFAEVENLVLTGTDDINGTGNALANRITGNDGNNVLNGGGGNDTLLGGEGDDTYFVDDGNDVITEQKGEGIDTVTAAVSISLAGFSEIENIELFSGTDISATGSDTDNKITGNGGKNTLSGGNGNDTLIGEGDNVADTLIGGAGNDVFFIEGSSLDTVSDSGGIDTVSSTKSFTMAAGIEIGILTGSGTMTANNSNNTLTGSDGDDTLDGLGGADLMIGLDGNDTYFVDNVGDVVQEDLNKGTDIVFSKISYKLADNVENLTLLGTAGINGTGNDLANIITGTNGNNRLDGGAGDDIMNGGKGNDTYVVDSNKDDIQLDESGTDTVEATVTYSIESRTDIENLVLKGTGKIDGTGNFQNNVITGNSGDNLLVGNAGKDTLNGGDGDDTLVGGDTLGGDIDTDAMAGGDGNDTYVVGRFPGKAADSVTEAAGKGDDTVQLLDIDFTKGDYVLGANIENLEFIGNGKAILIGNGLKNHIVGGNEADFLNGGAGADTMEGGNGDDVYQIDSKDDVVIEAEDGDVLGDTLFVPFSVVLGPNDPVTKQDFSNFEHVILKQFTPTALNAIGNDSANYFTGNSYNNSLDGGKGDDKLFGFTGADTEIGGLGNDTLYYDNTKDLLVEENGETGGIDTVQSTLTVDLVNDSHFKNIENIELLGTGALKGFGTDGDNIISGNLGANLLDGRKGNDTIFGSNGNDTIEGGEGDDSMDGGAGNDLYFVDTKGDVVGESDKENEGTDTVQSKVDFTLAKYIDNLTLVEGSAAIVGIGNDGDGTPLYLGKNIIIGNANANKLSGLGGNDTLTGGDNDDTMDGGTGIDLMTGGNGKDVYIVDETTDKVVEGTDPGLDRVESSATFTLTANVEDLVLTGTKDINGTGNALKNDITGNSGANVLDGLAGPDTMHGGLGDDTYVLDDVSKLGDLLDVVDESGGGGSDTLKTGMRSIDLDADTAIHVEWTDLENVWLTGSKALNAFGDAGNNRLTGNTAANSLLGRAGNDTMDGGAGADTMDGGAGDDTYTIDNTKDVIIEGIGQGNDTVSSFVTYTLAPNFENITLLGTGNINATGSDDNNVIIGNKGNNIIDGKGGADDMTGGLGNDTYWVDNAGDKVTENASEGTDSVKSTIDFSLDVDGVNVENLTLLEGAKINGIGNGAANIIIGNSNNNLLSGLAGNDTLTGGDGNDTLNGGTDNDIMSGGKGSDVYFVDSSSDKVIDVAEAKVIDTVNSTVSYTLGANLENLTLLGDAGKGIGNGADNHIIGNSEGNFIDGVGGNDTMEGGKGDDTYRINSKLDIIFENSNEGIDTVQSGITIDSLTANVENVFLFGQTAISATGNGLDNKMQGSFGSNHLFGLGGNDTLIGAGGTDTLEGGAGSDSFQRIKIPAEGIDVITDFKIADDDHLDITDMLTNSKGEDIFNETGADKNVLSDFVHVVQSGNNTLVQVDANGGHNSFSTVYVLQNVSLSQAEVEAQILTEHPTA